MTGVDNYTDERLRSRVTDYKLLTTHAKLARKLDQADQIRGGLNIFCVWWVAFQS